MAEKVGSIYFDLDLDDAKFKRGMAGADAAAKSTANTLSKDVRNATRNVEDAFDSFRDKANTALNAVALSAVAMTTALGAYGINYGKSLQSLQLSFQSLSGDAEKGKKMFGELYGLARQLPLAFADIAEGGKLLMAANIPAEKIVDTMKQLSLVSMSTGVDLNTLTDTYAKVNGQGRASLDQLDRLASAGIYPRIAQQMGIPIESVRKAVTDGKVSLEDFNSAVLNMTDPAVMQEFEKSAQRSFSSFKGAINDAAFALVGLKISAEGGFEVLQGGLFEQVVEGAMKFAKTLRSEEVQGALKEVGAKISQFTAVVVPPLFEAALWLAKNLDKVVIAFVAFKATMATIKVASFIGDLQKANLALATFAGSKNAQGLIVLKNAFVGLATGFKVMATTMVAGLRTIGAAIMANPIGLIITAIVAVIAALVWLQVKFNIFGKLFDALKPVFKSIGDALSKVGDVFKKVFGFIGNIVKSVIGFVVGYIKWYLSVWVAVFQAVWTAIQWVFNAIMAVWNTVLKPVFDAIMYVLQALFTIVWTIFSGIFTVVWTIVSTLAQILFVIFQGIYNFIVNTILTPIFNFFRTIFTAIWNTVTTIFTAVWNTIKLVATSIWNTIVSIFTAIWNFYVSIFTTIWNFISGIFTSIWNTIAKIINGIWTTITNVFTGIWNTLSGIVSRIWNTITGTFSKIAGAVGGAIKSAWEAVTGWGGKMIEAGKNLIDGIVKGVMNAKDAVVNKVKEICKGALDAVKNFFGIKSPSRVMASMGEFLMEGMKNGIDDAGTAAIRTAQAVSSKIADGINSGIEAVSSGTSKISGLYGNMYQNLNGMALANAQSLDSAVGAMSTAQQLNVENGGAIAGSPINVQQNNSGIVARSRQEWRDIIADGIEAVDEDLQARGLPTIGNGNVKGSSNA